MARAGYFSCERKSTTASNFCGGRFLNDGIGAVGFTSVRAIPWRGQPRADVRQVRARARRCRCRRSCGTPGSPTGRPPACRLRIRRASARPPATTAVGRRHFDRRRRARVGALVGEEGHRADHDDARQRRDRPALGAALGPAVVERQQEQQDHADRRARRSSPAATRLGGLITRRSSNRKKKYHSGRGT